MILALILAASITNTPQPAQDIGANLQAFVRASFSNFDGSIRGNPSALPGPENRTVYRTVWPRCDVVAVGTNRILSCYWNRQEPQQRSIDVSGFLRDFNGAADVLRRRLGGYHETNERCEQKKLFGLRKIYARAGSPSIALRGIAVQGGYSIILDIAPYGRDLHPPSAMKPPPCG